MSNTRLTISMPADAVERMKAKLATMTPEEISAAFGVEVISVNFPQPTIELEVESDMERDLRAGKRG